MLKKGQAVVYVTNTYTVTKIKQVLQNDIPTAHLESDQHLYGDKDKADR